MTTETASALCSSFPSLPGKVMYTSNTIDLTPLIDGDVVYWDIPEGLWRIFIITAHYGLGDERRDKYINPLTSQGTRILIDTVYEAHYKHYAREFGKTIKGFFSDEPQCGGGYGYNAKIGRSPKLALPWSDEAPYSQAAL